MFHNERKTLAARKFRHISRVFFGVMDWPDGFGMELPLVGPAYAQLLGSWKSRGG